MLLTPLSATSLQTCEEAVSRLLTATGASRCTLRREDASGLYPVVAEARETGINTLVGQSGIDIRATETFQAIEKSGRLLLQEDFAFAIPPPPPQLVQIYGARAQMLAPIRLDGRVVAFVSVHECKGPRPWSETDVESLITETKTCDAALQLGNTEVGTQV